MTSQKSKLEERNAEITALKKERDDARAAVNVLDAELVRLQGRLREEITAREIACIQKASARQRISELEAKLSLAARELEEAD